ncbi:MAG: glycosyltransferase family 25 protein, partial [Muribaculaceae bacterium]|nr:glycosyltransferase family 25 protein [Muribaculaceae bacterium]
LYSFKMTIRQNDKMTKYLTVVFVSFVNYSYLCFMNELPAILVLHVRSGYEDRGAHITKMMARLGLSFTFFTDGDICDMNDNIRRKIFTGRMLDVSPALQSCTYKHLLACKLVVDSKLPGALILEDDISLGDNFPEVLEQALSEYRDREDTSKPAIISFEATRLRFVPRSQRRSGQILYPGPHDRLAGAYYINAAACRELLDFAETNKIHLPVDNLHTYLTRNGRLNYYWTEPSPAIQGSFDGTFPSSLSIRHPRLAPIAPIIWRMKYLYRRLLYFFR